MKYVFQMMIILIISLAGELLNKFIPLPIPGSIYGMVIFFVLLLSGLLKLSAVEETGKFLVEIMPLTFIPAGVGLMNLWSVLKPMIVSVSIITIVSLLTVMVFSGRITQAIIRKDKEKEK